MSGIGFGALPDPATVDPTEKDRWVVPATSAAPRRFYTLLDGEWVRYFDGRVIDHTDAVTMPDGSIVPMADVTEHLTEDYRALISAGF